MKKSFLLCIIIGVLSSCEEDENPINSSEPELVSQWELVEVYADPGSGQGSFEPVNSDKTISLFDNGTLISNGDICSMATEANSQTSGIYTLADSTFNSQDCNNNHNYQFKLNGDTMVIYYPCIEPCQAKYKKV